MGETFFRPNKNFQSRDSNPGPRDQTHDALEHSTKGLKKLKIVTTSEVLQGWDLGESETGSLLRPAYLVRVGRNWSCRKLAVVLRLKMKFKHFLFISKS